MLKSINTKQTIVEQFRIAEKVESINPYGSGHINDTFLVKTLPPASPNYILQKINHHIFSDIPQLMNNILRVTEHLHHQFTQLGIDYPERYSLKVILTESGQPYFIDDEQQYWRLYVYIENTCYYHL